VQKQLTKFAAAQRLPLILTEVGYPSRDGAAMAPWDYTRDGEVDLEEQRRALAALARSWPGAGLLGVMIWEIAGDGGSADIGYSPRGKPAWCVLAAWWRAPTPCAVASH
jgi:pyruvate/2-oxoacid:ferredoxin oxidoreductase beta subunit